MPMFMFQSEWWSEMSAVDRTPPIVPRHTRPLGSSMIRYDEEGQPGSVERESGLIEHWETNISISRSLDVTKLTWRRAARPAVNTTRCGCCCLLHCVFARSLPAVCQLAIISHLSIEISLADKVRLLSLWCRSGRV